MPVSAEENGSLPSNGVQVNMDKIREATDRILSLNDLLVGLPNSHVVLYQSEGGSIVGECLHNVPTCAIMRCMCPAGSRLPAHLHDETEWTIVVSGSLELRGKTYGPGDGFCLSPTENHDMYFHENSVIICLTIPSSSAYPKLR